MARGSADALFKKNSKLESFLKRTLQEESFERVRAYESCIVVSDKENKAFKYVVLGDEWIYLTENPPKSIQEAVCLKNIVSVELVNDYPDFLFGEERENTQHIAITHWTSNQKRRSTRRSKKSKTGSTSDLQGDRSNLSTPLGFSSQDSSANFSEDYGYVTQSLSSLQISGRPDSRGSVSSYRDSKGGSKKKKRLGDSLDENLLKSLKEEIEDSTLEDIEEKEDVLSSGAISVHPKSGKKRELPDRSKSPTANGIAKKHSISNTSQTGSVRPLPPSPSKLAFATPRPEDKKTNVKYEKPVELGSVYETKKPSICCCTPGLFCFKKSKIIPSSEEELMDTNQNENNILGQSHNSEQQCPPDIHVDTTSEGIGGKGFKGSVVSLQTVASRRSSITTLRGHSRAGTPFEGEATRSGSNLGMASYSDFGESMSGMLGIDGNPPMEMKKVVLNIYLLNLHSPMLMLIRSAWSNNLIRSTVAMDSDFDFTKESKVFSTSVRGSQNQREKNEVLFNQLKRELLNPENSMEETFSLLNELKMATEKNFTLKKLFWKDMDLFMFLVRQLQRYLPRSPININTVNGRLQRVDEFELSILMIEVLSLMFRESEIIPSRIQALKAERGKAVLDLLMVLTCKPEIPEKYAAPLKRQSSLRGTLKTEDLSDSDTDTNKDEIDKQLEEFTQVSLIAVFELFLMAQQQLVLDAIIKKANWGYSEGNFFNISWMVKTLEEIRTTEQFVDRVIQQMMKLISPSRSKELSPEEALILYHQFSVLETFLQYSPRIKVFIHSNYLEEFKYFVQVPAILKKLPQSYPLCNMITTLIEKVMSRVLDSTGFPKSPR